MLTSEMIGVGIGAIFHAVKVPPTNETIQIPTINRTKFPPENFEFLGRFLYRNVQHFLSI